jgi:hypothetical protein
LGFLPRSGFVQQVKSTWMAKSVEIFAKTSKNVATFVHQLFVALAEIW